MLCADTAHDLGIIGATYQMKTEVFLATHPVFSLSTAERLLPGHVRKKVTHAVKTGKVVRLRRGLFASVPPGADPGLVVPDRYLVMVEARPDVVLAGHCALELLGLAHSEWTVCSGYGDSRRTSFEVAGVTYKVVGHPAPIVGPFEELGVDTSYRQGLPVRHLGPERCLVDGFDRPRLFGGIVELVKSLDGLRLLDFALVESLLGRFQSKTLFGGVGWFLERNQRDLFVSPDLLTRLESQVPRGPHYLERRSGTSVWAKRWNVFVPRELVTGEDGDA